MILTKEQITEIIESMLKDVGPHWPHERDYIDTIQDKNQTIERLKSLLTTAKFHLTCMDTTLMDDADLCDEIQAALEGK